MTAVPSKPSNRLLVGRRWRVAPRAIAGDHAQRAVSHGGQDTAACSATAGSISTLTTFEARGAEGFGAGSGASAYFRWSMACYLS